MSKEFLEIIEQYGQFLYLATINQGWDLTSHKEEPLSEMSKSQLNELSKYLRNFARNDLHDEALRLLPYCDNSLKKVEQNLQILVVKKLYQINREIKNRKLEDKKN